MLRDAFDFNQVYGQGVQVTALQPAAARVLLRLAMAQSFVADPTLGGLTRPDTRGRAAWHTQHRLPEPQIAAFGERLLAGPLAPLVTLYRSSAMATCRPLLYRCTAGYAVDWHDHLDYPSILTVLVYLSPDGLVAEDGGVLEVARVTRDHHGRVVARAPATAVVATHGTVALLDGHGPVWQHRVTPLRSDKIRYLLIYAIGTFFADAGGRPDVDHTARD